MTWAGRLALAAAAGALTLPGAAIAQAQTENTSSEWTFFGWNVSARVSAAVAPDYLGARTYSVGPTGSLTLHRPGVQSTFRAPDDSPSLQLFGDKELSAGVVVRGRSARDDHNDLRGIHKIDFALEPGVYAEWWPMDGLRLHGEARHGALGNSAWSGDVAADLVHDHKKWLLSIGPRVHLGESRFTRTYFDISAADAARSPFRIAPFASNGAYVAAGGLASAEYRWSRQWSILTDVRYDRLLGDAADSPIVARLGSRDQFRGALGVRYRFGR